MKARTELLFLILLVALLSCGCIDELVPTNKDTSTGNVSSYEFNVFANHSFINGSFTPSATFYLTKDGDTKAVYMVQNTSVLDIIIIEDMSSSNKEPFSNIVVLKTGPNETIAYEEAFLELANVTSPSSVNYTISEDVVRGQKHKYLNFNEPVTGFIAFAQTSPKGQEFFHVTTSATDVRFVLPEGYTTGNRFIGRSTPAPDLVYKDISGRNVLLWKNKVATPSVGLIGKLLYINESEIPVEHVPRVIAVQYYSEYAPLGLLVSGAVLGFAALLVLSHYRRERKRLADLKDEIEFQASRTQHRKRK